MQNFDPQAATIDEQDIEARWQTHLRHRLRVAEQHFREFHPTIAGGTVTPAEVSQAIQSLTLPSPSKLAVHMARIRRKQGKG